MLLSDEMIVSLYHARNENAIAETDRKYGKYLLSIAYHILKNESDSAECQNDTYLRTWNSIPPQKPTLLAAYLAKIMRSTAINRYHANLRDKRIPPSHLESLSDFENVLPDGYSVEAELEAKRIAKIISDYLRSIPKRRRYIFLCRYFAQYPIDEIAKRAEVSLSTVKKDLSKTKKELEQQLRKEEVAL